MTELLTRLLLFNGITVDLVERVRDNYYKLIVNGKHIEGDFDKVTSLIGSMATDKFFDADEVVDIALLSASIFFKISEGEILKPSRKGRGVAVRQILHTVLKKNFKGQMTLKYLAERIGNLKQHSTVLYSIKTVNGLYDVDQSVRQQYIDFVMFFRENLRKAGYAVKGVEF